MKFIIWYKESKSKRNTLAYHIYECGGWGFYTARGIYRRKERVCRCRSSVMKGTVIWLHLLCALYIKCAGRQARKAVLTKLCDVPPSLQHSTTSTTTTTAKTPFVNTTSPPRGKGLFMTRKEIFRIISRNSSDYRFMISRLGSPLSFALLLFLKTEHSLKITTLEVKSVKMTPVCE